MQTQAEFVAERIKAHRDACEGMDTDPVFQMLLAMNDPTPVTISQRERDAYSYSAGFMLKRQAE